jgi:hypothetical protein
MVSKEPNAGGHTNQMGWNVHKPVKILFSIIVRRWNTPPAFSKPNRELPY